MKTKLGLIVICHLLPAICLCSYAQGTAFTYQGRLSNGGGPASGVYDFRFRLDADPLGNTVLATETSNAIGVTNGLFITTIDFGAGWFAGGSYWLEIGVRTNGAGGYAGLLPLESLTPTPYAIFATTASNVSGVISAAQISGALVNGNLPASPVVTGTVSAGSFAGNGANVTNVNAAALNGLVAINFWQLGGNNVASSQFFGSTNNLPVRIRVNNQRALIITTNPADSANLIGGSPANAIDSGVEGSVIAGGGTTNFLGASSSNHISEDFSSIGGGSGNWIQAGSDHSGIGSGWNNLIAGSSYQSVIAGGQNNSISNTYSAIGGGQANTIPAGGEWAVIAGGNNNTNSSSAGAIAGGQNNLASGQYQSAVGGGYGNQATNNYATVPGGAYNIAGGPFSFAAGNHAQATDAGAFVWADSQNSTFGSTSMNQFSVRANGGVRLVTGGAGLTLDGQPVLTNNQINPSFSGAVTAPTFTSGGGNFVAGDAGNSVSGEFMAVGGGSGNVASAIGLGSSTIGGGYGNNINAECATVGGGGNNRITGPGDVIGGGGFDGTDFPGNTAGGIASVIGGGVGNLATGNEATVPGGYGNFAGGAYSFAAGLYAQATNQGAFVWADSQGLAFSSTAADQFLIRAQGGVGINTANPNGAALAVQGNQVGGFATPASLVQNNSTAVNASPALRVVAYGNTINGALSVSAQGTGLIAQFGNGNAFVSQLDTNGNWTANSFNGNGSGLTGLDGSSLDRGTIPNSVLLNFQGSANTLGGGQNNTSSGPFQSTVGGGYGNMASANYATVGGGIGNHASAGYATTAGGQNNTNSSLAGAIAGGQNNTASGMYQSTIGGGYGNTAGGNYSTIGGGFGNHASASFTTIGGGLTNTIYQQGATIGGGEYNLANADGATIGGGLSNAVSGDFSTIGGGYGNLASATFATIGGGDFNQAAGNFATVPGGYGNHASGAASFAAGASAQAVNNQSFVWSDGSAATTSTADGQFMVRASGGVVIYSSNGAAAGVALAAGSGTWSSLSDRNAKQDFALVTPEQVLDRVAALPITKWSYKTEPGVRHIGPMAQDFYAAFSVGLDDKHITTVDEGGVALAAIQGLNQKLETEAKEKDAEIQSLKRSVSELKQLVQTLAAQK